MKTLVLAGRLIDGTGAPARAGAGIVLEDGRIVLVGSEAEAGRACPDPDEEVDARASGHEGRPGRRGRRTDRALRRSGGSAGLE
jgi:N-acyl-D-aspartate/D-glutamate deacylase